MKKQDESLEDELREISPLLYSLHQNRKDYLSTPSGYFGQLPGKVIERLRHQSAATSEKPLRSGRNRWQHSPMLPQDRVAVAIASFAILIFVGIRLLQSEKTGQQACSDLHCLSPIEVEAYVKNHIDFSSLDLLLDEGSASAALEGLALPIPSPEANDLEPALMEVIEELNPQEFQSLF